MLEEPNSSNINEIQSNNEEIIYNEQNEENINTKEKVDLNNENSEENTKNIETDIQISKHKKCVPLDVYQKVFNDKQKLIEQLEEINNKLKNETNEEKINIISSLQSKLKIVENSNKTLENILIKQEKAIINLKSKLTKYEKLLNKKSEEILMKDNIINDLKEKIEELIEKNKNLKNIFKLNEKNEILRLNEIINNLKNELELNKKKFEFNNKKFENLQVKYLKLFQQNKKNENEFLLKLTKEQLINKTKNNYDYPQMKTMENVNSQTININTELNINLPKINDNSLSVTVKEKNNSKKNKIINMKKSYNVISNNE